MSFCTLVEQYTDRAVLCVAASEHYDESDYIRSYEAFLQYKNLQDIITQSLIDHSHDIYSEMQEPPTVV